MISRQDNDKWRYGTLNTADIRNFERFCWRGQSELVNCEPFGGGRRPLTVDSNYLASHHGPKVPSLSDSIYYSMYL